MNRAKNRPNPKPFFTPSHAALARAAYRAADIRLRRAGKSRGLLGRREVENRRPGVRHAHRVVRVDFPPANGPGRHDSGSAGGRAVGGDEEQVAGLERCLAEKFPDDARQPPEIGGGHDAYDLVLKNIAAVAEKYKIMIISSLCRPQPARFLPQLFDRLLK